MNIKDIAKLAGVSTATVSRYLNESGYVKEETRQKIAEVIKEHNYIPNAIARSLIRQESSTIGVIVPDITNEFFSEVFEGISSRLDDSTYTIMFFNSEEDPEKESHFLEQVYSERLKGLIIGPVSGNNQKTAESLRYFEKQGIHVVLVDRNLDDYEFDGVFADNRTGAYDGTKALIQAGHKRLAIIKGSNESLPGRDRYLGFLDAVQEADLNLPKDYIKDGFFMMDDAYQATLELLDLKTPPTGIFSSNNTMTLGALRALEERGLEIGKDIGLVGFDRIATLSLIHYPLTTVNRDAFMQGWKSMDILLNKVENEKNNVASPLAIDIIPTNLSKRGSEKINL